MALLGRLKKAAMTKESNMKLLDKINKKIIGRIATFPEELELLSKYTELEGDHLEIGCLWGATAILAALTKIKKKVAGHVYTVDFMTGGFWVKGDPLLDFKIPTLEMVMQNIKTFGVEDRVSVIVDRSSPLPIPKDVKPTSALIDGDHRKPGCLLDWMNVNHLKPDYVLFHDYDEIHPGVQEVVDYIKTSEPEWQQDGQAKSMIAFKRVKPDEPRPTVSVIVPTFNRSKMLERALKSITKQTFQDYEIIVVNDFGLPVEKVVNEFDKARLINHEANKGLSGSRNTGIKASRGKYITFLDDDDVISPNSFEVLVKAMEEGATLAYSDYYVWKNEDEVIKAPSFDYEPSVLARRNIFAVHCSMTRRELFELELFDENLISHEDYDMWLRLSQYVNFVHVPQYTAYYSIRADSGQISSQDYHAKYLQIVRQKNAQIIKMHSESVQVAAPVYENNMPVKVKRYFVIQIDGSNVKGRVGDTVYLPFEKLNDLRRGGFVE